MEGDGGKWGGNGGEMGGWGMGIAHGMWVVEGCGGMWLRKTGQKGKENGKKNGRKWEEMGGNTHFSLSYFSLFLPEVEDLPHSSLCKNQLTALTDGKMAIVATPTLTATAASADACVGGGMSCHPENAGSRPLPPFSACLG